MVFRVADFEKDVLDPKNGLSIYFNRAIKGYDNLKGDYQFLFACYSKNEFYYHQVSGTK